MKRFIIISAILAMLWCGSSLERYSLTVTASAEQIQARNTKGVAVQLTPCYTDDGIMILLDDVEPNHTYRVTLDRNESYNTEDDLIVKVCEVVRS